MPEIATEDEITARQFGQWGDKPPDHVSMNEPMNHIEALIVLAHYRTPGVKMNTEHELAVIDEARRIVAEIAEQIVARMINDQ